jgi:1-acyl-sn-glycerol-3-phosphate acyltransferase
MQAGLALIKPLMWLTNPVFRGFEKIPDEGPLMFVGNHTLYGVLDVPYLFAEIYRQKGIVLRGLADHMHFKFPGWRELIEAFGVIPGTREGCGQLLDEGEAVLVFPGGAREVSKRKGEGYKLVWKQRIGFAKLALQHRCTVVPFAAIGVDDAFEIAYDAEDIMNSPVGPLLKRMEWREDAIPPIASSFRPERLYFRVSDPISVESFDGRSDDEACWDLRRQVAASIEEGIDRLMEERSQDPQRSFGARLKAATDSLAARFKP